MANMEIPDWFNHPQGIDAPSALQKQCKTWRNCKIVINEECISGKAQVLLDSQQPRLAICLKSKEYGQIIFPMADCPINPGIEGEDEHTSQFVHIARQKHDDLQGWKEVYYYQVWCCNRPVIPKPSRQLDAAQRPTWDFLMSVLGDETKDWSCPELTVFLEYKPAYRDVAPSLNWISMLQGLATNNQSEFSGKSFWWYEKNPADSTTGCHPLLPWLWTRPNEAGYQEYIKWEPVDPFFIDDRERRYRLSTASNRERETQCNAITQVFNPSLRHNAYLTVDGVGKGALVHVKLSTPPGTSVNIPELPEGTIVRFQVAQEHRTYEEGDLLMKGNVVELDSAADLVIATKGFGHEVGLHGNFQIVTLVKPNTMPIDEQLKALHEASTVRVHGDTSAGAGQGFSLKRTLLGHGSELNPDSPHYFVLDFQTVSPLQPHLQKERLAYIRRLFPLDDAQMAAFVNSTSTVTCGVSLIQGPPGTGKTRTAVAIILALTALRIKVLVVAGSNKAVDNLLESLALAAEKDKFLSVWCGQFVRFRTPAYQLSQIRAKSASDPIANLRAQVEANNDNRLSHSLEKIQMHNLAVAHAHKNPEDKHCKSLLEYMAIDKEKGLSRDSIKKLRSAYDNTVMGYLEGCSVVATTLSNASHDVLRLSGFKPGFVVSDEAGQCVEGDHCIALTMTSVRGVVLIGDPDQLSPTVISEHGPNEGARFLKRSLMERLYYAGYPCIMLTTNYRNHSQILDFFNAGMYKGELNPGPDNDRLERVGSAWDSFTRSRHYFRALGVDGVRRLFISVIGNARRMENSLSWSNESQVHVLRHLLTSLYSFQTPDGHSVLPDDVMIISPYKDQKVLVQRVLGRYQVKYRDNLTVDAAQGQEAPIVVFLMTKPSENAASPGFVADANRLNVALSRAKKVMIIIGNLAVWDDKGIIKIHRSVGHRARLLVDLLKDVTSMRHTLTWTGEETVTETQPIGPVQYISHDRPGDIIGVYQSGPPVVAPPTFPAAPVVLPFHAAHVALPIRSASSAPLVPPTDTTPVVQTRDPYDATELLRAQPEENDDVEMGDASLVLASEVRPTVQLPPRQRSRSPARSQSPTELTQYRDRRDHYADMTMEPTRIVELRQQRMRLQADAHRARAAAYRETAQAFDAEDMDLVLEEELERRRLEGQRRQGQ
ncbi:P-loop containing nucleoside triphosphate hydrolase protein [Aspergillus sergii]|uniref:P-loop containing nucleoside triphosphate hydrolase protein n=1 Tax=Aspergillus sergii TaxID=1034303 RepID=A0A5N6WSJ2_9EURO|nr:P-loop containing nucleoside triphosphate hydrolase protein [Aspergillus sergii]